MLQGDQEVGRMACQRDVCPCITPHGRYYVTSIGKFLTGVDAAAVQGITLPDLKNYGMHELEDSLLRDLAGNSFSMPITIISLLSVLLDMGTTLDA